MAGKNDVEIEIILKGAKAAKDIKVFARDVESGFKRIKTGAAVAGKGLGQVGDRITGLKKGFSALKMVAVGALVAISTYGGVQLAKGFIQTAASVETLKIQLDTITKGKGLEWFEKLNEWALKMPVDTQGAIEVFKNLSAMGLKPTIEDMTVLVDTTSALGGGADVMMGIARALGQMYTKGKASAEELMQLAERGVPAYEILKDKLNLTGEELEKIATSGIKVDVVIKALLEGMNDRFGGASKAMQETGKGLWTSLVSYFKEFQRLVMEGEVWDTIKEKLSAIIVKLDEMKKTGDLDKWAERVSNSIMKVYESATKLYPALEWVFKQLQKMGLFETDVEKIKRQMESLNKELAAQEQWQKTVSGLPGPLRSFIEGNEGEEVAQRIAEIRAELAKLQDQLIKAQGGYAQPWGASAEEMKRWEEAVKSNADAVEKGAEKQKEQAEAAKELSNYIITTDEHGKQIVISLDKAADKTAILVKEAAAAASSYSKMADAAKEVAQSGGAAPGMKYGGPVLPMQAGGAIPGFGGGDKHLRLLEGGEEVLDKYTASYARQRGILDALRKAAHGGGQERGYFKVDFGFPTANIPNVQITADEAGEALMEYIRRGKMTKGNF
ncbi:MAG: tape measure protein [Deltaproteobacteria bacterium]|nr:tape measure protein [Deltaproteobacteria bacterium]